MAPHSPLHSLKITVTADERDRVLRNPMVILAQEHMRQCGFSEEDVQQGSAMRTVGGSEQNTRNGEAKPQVAPARGSVTASAALNGTSEASSSRHERITVGWGPARHA